MSKNIPGKKIYAVIISYKSAPVLEELYNRIDKNNFETPLAANLLLVKIIKPDVSLSNL